MILTRHPGGGPTPLVKFCLQAPLTVRVSQAATLLGALVLLVLAFVYSQALLLLPIAALTVWALKLGPFKDWYAFKQDKSLPLPPFAQERLNSAALTLHALDDFFTRPHFKVSQEFKDILDAAHCLYRDVLTDVTSGVSSPPDSSWVSGLPPAAFAALNRLALIDDVRGELMLMFKDSRAIQPSNFKAAKPAAGLEATLDSLPFKCSPALRFKGIYE